MYLAYESNNDRRDECKHSHNRRKGGIQCRLGLQCRKVCSSQQVGEYWLRQVATGTGYIRHYRSHHPSHHTQIKNLPASKQQEASCTPSIDLAIRHERTQMKTSPGPSVKSLGVRSINLRVGSLQGRGHQSRVACKPRPGVQHSS